MAKSRTLKSLLEKQRKLGRSKEVASTKELDGLCELRDILRGEKESGEAEIKAREKAEREFKCEFSHKQQVQLENYIWTQEWKRLDNLANELETEYLSYLSHVDIPVDSDEDNTELAEESCEGEILAKALLFLDDLKTFKVQLGTPQWIQFKEEFRESMEKLKDVIHENYVSTDPEKGHKSLPEGIPESFDALEFPDDETRKAMEEEILMVDLMYSKQYNQLKETMEEIRRECAFTDHDMALFEYIDTVYDPAVWNLCVFEFKQKLLSKFCDDKSKSGVESMKREIRALRYLNNRSTSCIQEWIRWKHQIETIAHSLCQEYIVKKTTMETKRREKEKHLQHCRILKERIEKLRWQKMEEIRFKRQLEMEELEREKEKQKLKEKKMENHNRQKREKVTQYKLEKMRKRDEDKVRVRQEEEARQALLEKQSEENKIRVENRHKIDQEKQSIIRKQKEQRMKERQLQEEVLERLRNTVRVTASPDPNRLVQPTQCWLKHHEIKEEECMLFLPHYSFNDEKISNDKRIILEKKLREAGFINSEYASHLIKTLAFSDNRRPELISRVFE